MFAFLDNISPTLATLPVASNRRSTALPQGLKYHCPKRRTPVRAGLVQASLALTPFELPRHHHQEKHLFANSQNCCADKTSTNTATETIFDQNNLSPPALKFEKQRYRLKKRKQRTELMSMRQEKTIVKDKMEKKFAVERMTEDVEKTSAIAIDDVALETVAAPESDDDGVDNRDVSIDGTDPCFYGDDDDVGHNADSDVTSIDDPVGDSWRSELAYCSRVCIPGETSIILLVYCSIFPFLACARKAS